MKQRRKESNLVKNNLEYAQVNQKKGGVFFNLTHTKENCFKRYYHLNFLNFWGVCCQRVFFGIITGQIESHLILVLEILCLSKKITTLLNQTRTVQNVLKKVMKQVIKMLCLSYKVMSFQPGKIQEIVLV